MKKEELIAQAATQKAHIKVIEDQDEYNRQEISDALGAPSIRRDYGDDEKKIYTWFEIMFEIGKLMEKKDFMDFKEKFKQTGDDIRRLYEISHAIQQKHAELTRKPSAAIHE